LVVFTGGFYRWFLAVLMQNGLLQLRNKINASELGLNQAFTLCICPR
jgi:hypothetical protein